MFYHSTLAASTVVDANVTALPLGDGKRWLTLCSFERSFIAGRPAIKTTIRQSLSISSRIACLFARHILPRVTYIAVVPFIGASMSVFSSANVCHLLSLRAHLLPNVLVCM